jgi:ADP-heptose:LPS heptosyltransferase
MWPLERHIRVAIQVAQAKGLGVVILGDNPRHRDLVTKALVEFVDKESHKYEPPSPGFPGFSVVNLVGQTTVEEYAALISKCTLVITNDSASTHIAAAFDRPCVVVFGPTSLKWGFGPRSTHSAVAEVPLPCRPCHIHGPHICPLGHFRCMNDITVAMVKERALSLLAAPRNPTHNPTT